MTREEAEAELEKCKDAEYFLRNYCSIKQADGSTRGLTEDEIQLALKRGKEWAQPTKTVRSVGDVIHAQRIMNRLMSDIMFFNSINKDE